MSKSLPPNSLPALCRRLGEVHYLTTTSLTPYVGNPRKHPEKQIIKLMASLSEFGIAMPILVDEDLVVIAGHAVLEAAKRLGLAEVPVIIASHWSKSQVRAYRLASNKLAELSHWDDEALAVELAAIIELEDTPIEILGWETAEIDLILDAAGGDCGTSEDPADEILETPKHPVTRDGDIWLLGQHRLLCGSSLDAANWERLMDGRTAAMAFSDPPYNVPISGHVCGLGKIQHREFAQASGEMSKAEFTAFLTEAISRMAERLKDGALLDLCMDNKHIGEMLDAIEAAGLSYLTMCVWNKSNGGMGSLYRSKYELVFIAKKGKAAHTNNVQLGKYGRYRTNVWDYPGVNSFGKNRMTDLADHPTIKPVALMADAIRDVTHPGEIVLDAFMGSGTTILAAERTKRIACGIELEPGYVDVAIGRWEAMTGKQAVLAETGELFAEVVAARAATTAPDEPAESLDA